MQLQSWMTIVRTIILTCLLIPVTSVYSQSKQNRAEERTKLLQAILTLTDDQTSQVRQIMDRLDQQSAQIRELNRGNKRTIMKSTRARIADADKEIEALLTPVQLKKFGSYKNARRDEFRGWRTGKGSEYNF